MNLFPSLVIDKRKFYSTNSTYLYIIVPNGGNGKRIRFTNNSVQLFLVGLCVGITLGIAIIPLLETDCDLMKIENINLISSAIVVSNSETAKSQVQHDVENFPHQFAPSDTSSRNPKMLRPRFYSTELGIKKKLVAGIVVTDYRDFEKVVALNKTLSRYVNQLLFFVLGQDASLRLKQIGVTSVVTLSSKRNVSVPILSKLSAFHYNRMALRAIKYLGDKLSDSHSFFYLATDMVYTNGIALNKAIDKVTVSQNVFWGFITGENEFSCALEPGIVLSRFILKKLSARLDRCLLSEKLREGDVLRNCFKYSLGSIECSGILRNQLYMSVRPSEETTNFYKAISIGPISNAAEMYEIHLMITKLLMEEIDMQIENVSKIINRMMPLLPEKYLNNNWPLGFPASHHPHTRFDILQWKLFSRTSVYPKDDHTPGICVSKSEVEELDISFVVNASLGLLHETTPRGNFHFQFGYRRLDETRGMEYILHFQDEEGMTHRLQSLKPLSRVEMVPMPFVTEARRVTIVVPVWTIDTMEEVDSFLSTYFRDDNKSNAVIIVAIVLRTTVITSEEEIKLSNLKRLITSYNSNHSKHTTGEQPGEPLRVGHIIVNLQRFRTSHPIISIFDMLSNHILGPNSLVLVMDIFAEITPDFLNRVRINTILNHQVYSPLPFMEYDPNISGVIKKPLEIHKSTGYFDSNMFHIISFFIGDYSAVRKQLYIPGRFASGSPILSQSMRDDPNGIQTLTRLFILKSRIHLLRAPEPHIVIRFNSKIYKNCSESRYCFKRKWGSKAELAKLILRTRSSSSLKSL